MSYTVLDFESYYDKDYSLRKMTPVEYLQDPRFECTGCAIVEGDEGMPFWRDGDDLKNYLKGLKARQKAGEKIVVISHNALFDMCLLAWRFGIVPDLMVDTMGMSRALLYAFTGGVSLDKVSQHLGLPAKGDTIKNVSGMNAAAIKAAGLWEKYKQYAMHDAFLCREIFKILRKDFPRSEYRIMNMALRCAVVPRFKLDANLLAEHLTIIEANKQGLLARCGIMDKKELMSNEKFAQALISLGLTPPTKTSPTTGLETYAFAKSDPAMVELSEHDDPAVQALVAARVGHKSTLEETRTQKLLRIAMIDWHGGMGRGWAPIPLRYSGAHTHRLSGDWGLNAQNWPRVTVTPDGNKVAGTLRRAHVAPPGKKVVKCDASQIEARVVAWLAGQDDLVEDFRNGVDIYSTFAEQNIYHYPVSKATVDERFVGKGSILGLGFGMGAPKFRSSIASTSFTQLGRSILLTDTEAANVVTAYRRRFPNIPKAWKFLQEIIPAMARQDPQIEWGPVKIEHQAIRLPNGLCLYYHDLSQVTQKGKTEWVCKYGRMPKRIFGGKLFENVVQALARIITMEAAARMETIYPQYPLAHQVHDDLVFIVDDHMVEEFEARLLAEMSAAQSWYSDLPLAAESGKGQNYGDAK